MGFFNNIIGCFSKPQLHHTRPNINGKEGSRPADDDSVSAGTAPQGLVEQLQQRQDGGWVRQLSLKPAVQLQKCYRHLLGAFTHLLYFLYLQFSLCDASMDTIL